MEAEGETGDRRTMFPLPKAGLCPRLSQEFLLTTGWGEVVALVRSDTGRQVTSSEETVLSDTKDKHSRLYSWPQLGLRWRNVENTSYQPHHAAIAMVFSIQALAAPGAQVTLYITSLPPLDTFDSISLLTDRWGNSMEERTWTWTPVSWRSTVVVSVIEQKLMWECALSDW